MSDTPRDTATIVLTKHQEAAIERTEKLLIAYRIKKIMEELENEKNYNQ